MITFKGKNDWEVGEASMKEMVRYWYSEVDSLDLSHISNYTHDSATEHFAILAWSRTDKIGEEMSAPVLHMIKFLIRLRVDSVRRPDCELPLHVPGGLQLRPGGQPGESADIRGRPRLLQL